MKKKSTALVVFGAFLLALFSVLAASCIVFIFNTRPASSVANETTERIAVPHGMTVHALAFELEAKKMIRSKEAFYLAARYKLLGKIAGCPQLTLASGVYQVKSSMRIGEIFELVSTGKQEYLRVSFPEGLTISKIAVRLESAGVCAADDFKAAAKSNALIEKYAIASETLEGYLFPDTYFFTPAMSAESVAEIMVQNFFAHIQRIPSLAGLDISSDEFKTMLVLASIVEREYRVAEEAPLIASVFKNRMRQNMGLYSCATIEYIITEIQGKPHPEVITYDDLKIDNPYNTYKWAALPPTPISNPGMTALAAAADTPTTNYYYFRLTDSTAGKHSFSENFNEHIREGEVIATKKVVGS
ncbi:MAG: endolytic transglycosylase MltG [Treponema sp.]|nr:endolytic transglycosylase MltG [Treponema sp.]